MPNSQESERRVVITGMGIFSPLGIGPDTFWDNIAAGKSGISRLESVPFSAAPGNVGGEARDFTDIAAKKIYLKKLRKSLKVMCREIQLGVASALVALEHSGLDLEVYDRRRLGIDFGANLMLSPPDVLKDACWKCTDNPEEELPFEFERWGKAGDNAGNVNGMDSMEPLWLLRYLPNMPACHIGIAADARGPNNSITLAEASGNLAIGEATRIIQRGSADTMIAGSTGTRIHPVKTIHAALWDDLAESDDPPETWCRPFDKRRNGQVLAEGACSFTLEEESQARSRGATIYGTILGTGSSCVVSSVGKADKRKAIVNAMQVALNIAGIQPADVGHINANGVATIEDDRDEALAIQEVFGDASATIPVTALKSALGNSGAGCGILELAGSILGLRKQCIPATLNYSTPDPDCPLNVVHGEPLATDNPIVININFTRAGQASAVVVRAE